MKVLIVTNEGFENGGVSTYIKNLKRMLEENNHLVKILTSNRNHSQESFNDYSFDSIPEKPFFLKYFYQLFNLSSYRKIKAILNIYQPDIVHLNYIDGDTSPSVLLALSKIPTIFTMHDYSALLPPGISYRLGKSYPDLKVDFRDYGSLFGYVYENLKSCIYRLLIRNVDTIVVPSESMRKYFISRGISNIKTINNGTRSRKYSPSNLVKKSLLYVGRLSKEKGVEYLINSMSLLVKRHPKLTLNIIGDGLQKEYLADIISRLGLKDNIYLHGKVQHKLLHKYYTESTIVVIPSVCYESFSLVGIEAMSYGRPIVASNIGAIPEWLDNGVSGYLVRPADSEDLFEKINDLLISDTTLRYISTNAHLRSKMYSLKQHMLNIFSLYSETIEKHNKLS